MSAAQSNGKDLANGQELVTLTIDGKELAVPKGTNIIEAAKRAGIEIPHYCYHPHLSVPGNCRMCQIEIKGQPKLSIGCHVIVQQGMEVRTQHTSDAVKDAQAATLEFILINHPLDCTVCDQAGHCKLQDYHFRFNAKSSRFLEEKVHKVKAEPLGPTVMLDGERCIMCTRCIRFCDEVTGTSELGMLNRGDRSMIAINPGRELNNALSGSVVDLCPVGALTHRGWRFNSRIWFTKETDSICPGCSTGCNVRVAARDRQVVQVKARLNSQVNKEWLCDEGRYGFQRFLPEKRVLQPLLLGESATWQAALQRVAGVNGADDAAVFLSPDLLLEEFWVVREFVKKFLKGAQVYLAFRQRSLSKVEAVLVSPDYAANFKGAEFLALVSGDLEKSYSDGLGRLRKGEFKNVLCIGDRAILAQDCDLACREALRKAAVSCAVACDLDCALCKSCLVTLPGRSILEKSGLLLNRKNRLQYSAGVVEFPDGTEPDWRVLNRVAEKMGANIVQCASDRELTLAFLAAEERLRGLTIGRIKDALGVSLDNYKPVEAVSVPADAERTGAGA